jgi:hypothetical protein
VAEVLGPGFVLFGSPADLATEKSQGLTEAMRVEVGEVRSRKGVLENLPDGPGTAPMFAVETRCLKMATVADLNFRRWEQRIVETP